MTPDLPQTTQSLDVPLYDPAEIEARLRALGGADDFGPSWFTDSATSDLVRRLRSLLEDSAGPHRSLIASNSAIMSRLEDLAADAPNFAAAAGMLLRSAALARLTGTPMRVRPMLLIGEPGIGKTRFAKKCAAALGTEFGEFSFAQSDDIGVLLGHSLAWRGAQVGLLTRILLAGKSASPVMVIDEIEKAPTGSNAVPLDALHALLEPMSARDFMDPYLGIRIRADAVIWIGTANDISGIRPSILDRFLIIPVETPTPTAQRAVMRSIYVEAVAALAPGFPQDVHDDVLRPLNGQSPRTVRSVFELALGFAAVDGRWRLTATDIARAQRLVAKPNERSPIGFHAR